MPGRDREREREREKEREQEMGGREKQKDTQNSCRMTVSVGCCACCGNAAANLRITPLSNDNGQQTCKSHCCVIKV